MSNIYVVVVILDSFFSYSGIFYVFGFVFEANKYLHFKNCILNSTQWKKVFVINITFFNRYLKRDEDTQLYVVCVGSQSSQRLE